MTEQSDCKCYPWMPTCQECLKKQKENRMTEQEFFEKEAAKLGIDIRSYPTHYAPEHPRYQVDTTEKAWKLWQACAERKDKELAALRDFSQLVVESGDFLFIRLAKSLNLIDESGNPTPLLTGESE